MQSKPLSDGEIKGVLAAYGFRPDHSHCEAIRTYISLLSHWNQRVPLTTVVDPIDTLRFHFGESLFAACSVPIHKGRLADVGSGAGFPGLPLRLAVQNLEVSLIESNSKKAAFLSEVVRRLRLHHVVVVRERMEAMKTESVQFDYITARALGSHIDLLYWARKRLTPRGKLVLWLGEDDARAISNEKSWTWSEPIHIPCSMRRFILAGSAA
jgi:16S rRNA (guanine(527)-N(7))-methyltransferase RsmG